MRVEGSVEAQGMTKGAKSTSEAFHHVRNVRIVRSESKSKTPRQLKMPVNPRASVNCGGPDLRCDPE